MKIAYRPEIDGMRAIAVIAVLVYHLKIPHGDSTILPGGFLGVDLFFVLSGFLIAKILQHELLEAGRVDFGNFYARRIRRIIPPLLMVMIVSIPFAWAILLPGELARFGMSLLAGLGFASNIFWFYELGDYGAQSGLLQPFLHTWSLAIEEQFYLIFPLVLLGLFRVGGKRAVLAGIVSLLVFSLALAQLTTIWKQDLSFFSPVSRAWELLAGSMLAYLSIHHQGFLQANRLTRFMPTIALVVLICYFIIFSLQGWIHPGLPTLPFILASCALLWFSRPGEPVTNLLSTRPFVFIGKLSYSLYLWHFPVFAFGRLTSLDGVTTSDRVLWTIITFALSISGYYAVERPFRFRIPTRPFVTTVSMSIVAVALFTGLSRYSDTFTGNRLANLDSLYGQNNYDNEALKDISWSVLDSLTPGEKIIGTVHAHEPSEHEKNQNWFLQEASRKVLIIGNSHSKDLFNAMFLNADAFDGYEFARFGLASDFPEEQLEALLHSPNFEVSDFIVIAPRYSLRLMPRLPAIVKTLQSFNKEVLIIGNTAEFKSPSILPVFDWYIRQARDETSLSSLNSAAYSYEKQNVTQVNTELRQIAKDTGAGYLSRRDLICREDNKTCTLITPDGRKAMYDYGHWTLEGALHFGQVAAQEGWLTQQTRP